MKTASIWFVALCVPLSSAFVWANPTAIPTVHHCLNAQGRTVFQDQPCDSAGLRDAKRKQAKETPPTAGPVLPAQNTPRPAIPRIVNNPRTV